MNRYFLLFTFYFLFVLTYAQDPGQSEAEIIENTIETIAENLEDEEIDYTTLFDQLTELYEKPLNLNTASKEQLEQLYMLNEFQINNLLEHRENNGKLMAIYELQTVDGFDADAISKILPFVKISRDVDVPHLSAKEMLLNGKHELFIRYQRVLEEQNGFTPPDTNSDGTLTSRYNGSPDKLYTRYRFKYGTKISWGFTAEKDAGEELFKGNQQNGFDFYSAHISVKDIGLIKSLAIGDYHAQLGQGLTFWSGLAYGKSADVVNIKKNAQNIRPYTSVDENVFLRGVGTTIGIRDFELTAFFSRKKVDANFSEINILDTISDEVRTVSSFQLTGFHRTANELLDKDAIDETIYGTHLACKKRRINVGLTAVHSSYSADMQRDFKPYNQFEFSDQNNINIGADYNFIYRNFNLFGEFSRSKNGGIAYLNGMIVSLDPRLSFSLLQRNYQRDYQALFSNALGENSKNANEKGCFFGITAKPSRKWTISSYYDIFTFPWLKYLVDAPSHGNEFLTQITYTPSKKLEMYIRYKQEEKQKNTPGDYEEMIDHLIKTEKQSLRYNIKYEISESIKLRNRIELSKYQIGDEEAENGYLIFQDVMYKSLKSPISLTFRYALFDTDTYDSRIYAYENDILYAYSIPAHYFRGTRIQLTLRYHIIRGIDIWLRYSQTYYNNMDVISSGLNEIDGNTRSEVKAQVRFKL
ncbi:MAG: helix-hairpin-helix domain-containing protein [Bacteroidota bacterium]